MHEMEPGGSVIDHQWLRKGLQELKAVTHCKLQGQGVEDQGHS